MNWKKISTLLLGCFSILIGFTLPLVFETIFEAKLAERLILAPDSEMLNIFEKTPVPLYLQVYFFNITNPNEVLEGKTPILSQMGPYTYRLEMSKYNITWNHVLGTISYNEQRLYFFEPDKSNGSEDDEITTLNPVYVTAAVKSEELNFIIRSLINLFSLQYSNFKLVMTRKVRELAFDGYIDPVLTKLYELTGDPQYANGKTGFLYKKNRTIGPTVEIYSGELGMENYNKIYKYKGETKLNYYKADYCNTIEGTFGAQFPKPIRKSEPLYMFSTDLCRTIFLLYDKDTKLGPLTLHRFNNHVPFKMSNKNCCFCHDEFTCRDNMASISSCQNKAPIVISSPHFYLSSVDDINMIKGMNPIQSEHETFIDVEPNTGMTMRAAKRIQVNIALRRYSTFADFDMVKEVIFPILWVNESVEVPTDRAQTLHESLTGPKILVGHFSLIIVLIGFILILSALITLCCGMRKELKTIKRLEMLEKDANRKVVHGLLNEKINNW